MSEYAPIACIEHEKLEYAVLRRQSLRLDYREECGRLRTCVARPTDVWTRNGAEWLSFRSEDGAEGVIRLDRIVSARPA
jgi:Rho-binding antiterminator